MFTYRANFVDNAQNFICSELVDPRNNSLGESLMLSFSRVHVKELPLAKYSWPPDAPRGGKVASDLWLLPKEMGMQSLMCKFVWFRSASLYEGMFSAALCHVLSLVGQVLSLRWRPLQQRLAGGPNLLRGEVLASPPEQ